jgi:transposase InsO family protein
MPWQEVTSMELRREFVMLAQTGTVSFRELCRRFEISPKTGYKWLGRATTEGFAGLTDRSRRPHSSPSRTPAEMEAAVLALRDAHPRWGGRKLRQRLLDLGHARVPSASTISAILARHDRISPAATAQRQAVQRFEHPAPNALWQMDFMGHLPLASGRVHPLVVVDDHARYCLGLAACANEQRTTVQPILTRLFEQYGLPWAMLADNGPPWGVTHAPQALTRLGAWLVRLDVELWHGRPRHPQTQGKVERLHQTVAAEILPPFGYPDLAACQVALDDWRLVYNYERPHEAVGLQVPASRYQPSARPYPRTLPEIVYGPDDLVRQVFGGGQIQIAGRQVFISEILYGEPVALRPTVVDGRFEVYYCRHHLRTIDLNASNDAID